MQLLEDFPTLVTFVPLLGTVVPSAALAEEGSYQGSRLTSRRSFYSP